MNSNQVVALSAEVERNVAGNETYLRGVMATRDGTTRLMVESSDPAMADMFRHPGLLSLELKRVSIEPSMAALVAEASANADEQAKLLADAFAAGDEAVKNPPKPPQAARS